MTIIVFLIDTSASMNQRAYLGGRPSLLDVAKSAVEHFVKVRQRSPESRGDRYMLLTFEETPHNIKAGWKENLATFMNELKNLQCVGLTTLGAALKNAFDVLNINRMQTGIDTYGQGRCPFYLEPSVIVVITDGGKYTTMDGVPKDFTLPMHEPIPGSELTKEPFRWDQRLFSLVLRLSGTPAVDRDTGLVASDSSPIDAMCEVTGGRSYCVTSQRMMHQCIDSLVQKVQSGVVINFEKIGPDPTPMSNELATPSTVDLDEEMEEEGINGFTTNGISGKNSYQNSIGGLPGNLNNNTAWHSCRRLIYVPRKAQTGLSYGFWPIPESFWPDISANTLPPRSAHPNVKFTCTSQEPLVIETLPFDKYELEPSPLTQYILARKQPTICWQVFIANSYKNSEVGHPFGYLKASTNLTCVNLFVMPYNYPVLLPLIDDLFKIHRLKPSPEWRTQFTNYMRTMPPYYAGPLRRALQRMGVPAPLSQTLIPDNMENALSYSVLQYLKRLKNQAKTDFDRLCNDVISRQIANKSLTNGNSNGILEGLRVTPRDNFKKDLLSNSLDLREELNKFSGYIVGIKNHHQQRGAQSYRNAFDIPRKSLLDQVVRMRANFLQPGLRHTKLLDDDYVHSMPVSQMGNYQEYLKRMTPPLREIESTPVRQHMFGNPFKIDKRMMVDEADIDILGSTSSSPKGLKRSLASSEVGNLAPSISNRPLSKRKPGPIPREFRRPSMSPPNTPPSSPIPWAEDGVCLKRPSSPPLPPPPLEIPASTSVVTNVIIRSLNNNSPAYGNSNDAAPSEQKLVNGDLLTAGVFEPVLPTNTLKSSAAGNGENAVNNVDVISKSNNCATPGSVNSFGRTGTDQVVVRAELNSDSLVKESSSVVVKVKCEVESTSGYSNSSSCAGVGGGGGNSAVTTLNHVDERHGDGIKVEKDRPLTTKEQEEVKRYNSSVRNIIFKEVRRKGHNFSSIFTHLQSIQGTLDIRLGFVREVVKEAVRFKRQDLVNRLEEYLARVESQGRSTILSTHKLHLNGTKII